MRLVEVKSKRQFKQFLNVPKTIYSEDTLYVPAIRQEIQKILWDNKQPGDVGLWLLLNSKDQLIGRIAAFINKGNKGGLGFFECIDNSDAAKQLLDAGIVWLKQRKIDVVEALVNYGERDKFWGLLVKGFDRPSYQENYNPPYYQRFFEENSFEPSIRQSTQEVNPLTFNLEKMQPLSEKATSNPDIEIRCIEKGKLEKYATDFTTIYNAAWEQHEHFKPLTENQVLKLMKLMKPVMREDLVWFTYVKGKPAAFYVSILEANEIFQYLNGNMNLWGKLKFLFYRYTKPITKIRGLVFGVIPEYQGMGLTTGMMMKVFEVFQKDKHLKSSELAWIGDFNPKMLALMRSIGAKEVRQHVTYQKNI